MALTRRQRQVYDFIAGFVHSHGYSPSFEEIGGGLGLSSLATVHKHVSNLEKKGLWRARPVLNSAREAGLPSCSVFVETCSANAPLPESGSPG